MSRWDVPWGLAAPALCKRSHLALTFWDTSCSRVRWHCLGHPLLPVGSLLCAAPEIQHTRALSRRSSGFPCIRAQCLCRGKEGTKLPPGIFRQLVQCLQSSRQMMKMGRETGMGCVSAAGSGGSSSG